MPLSRQNWVSSKQSTWTASHITAERREIPDHDEGGQHIGNGQHPERDDDNHEDQCPESNLDRCQD